MDHGAKFEEVRIRLLEPVRGLDSISGVLGIPEWWPTGERVAIAIAHGEGSDLDDPLIEYLHRTLTQNQILTLRFNFPFAEKSRRAKPDSDEALELAYRCALSVLGRDPAVTPAHLMLAGFGIGGRIAARLASDRLPVDGLALFNYPLHPRGKPDQIQAGILNRVVAPMLFVHGSEDPTCRPDSLRRCLARVGAPTTDYPVQGAGRELIPAEAIPPPPTEPEMNPALSSAAPEPSEPLKVPEGRAERFAYDVVTWVQRTLDSQ